MRIPDYDQGLMGPLKGPHESRNLPVYSAVAFFLASQSMVQLL